MRTMGDAVSRRAVAVVGAVLFLLSGCGAKGKPCVDNLGCVPPEECGPEGRCIASGCLGTCTTSQYCVGQSCLSRYRSFTLSAPSVVTAPFDAVISAELAAGAPEDSVISEKALELFAHEGNTELSVPLTREGPNTFRWGPFSHTDLTPIDLAVRLDTNNADARVWYDSVPPAVTVSLDNPPHASGYSGDGLTWRYPAFLMDEAISGYVRGVDDTDLPVELSVDIAGHTVLVTDAGVRGTNYEFSIPVSDLPIDFTHGTLDVRGIGVDAVGQRGESAVANASVSRVYAERLTLAPDIGHVLPVGLVMDEHGVVTAIRGGLDSFKQDGTTQATSQPIAGAIAHLLLGPAVNGQPRWIHAIVEAGDGGESLVAGRSVVAQEPDASVAWDPLISDGLSRYPALTFWQNAPQLEAVVGLAGSGATAWHVPVGTATSLASRSVYSTPVPYAASSGPALVAVGPDAIAAIGDQIVRLTPSNATLSSGSAGTVDSGTILSLVPNGPTTLAGTRAGSGGTAFFESESDGGISRWIALPFGTGPLLVGQEGYWLLASVRTASSFDSRLCLLPAAATEWTCTPVFTDEYFASGFLAADGQIVVATQKSDRTARLLSFDRSTLAIRWTVADTGLPFPLILGCAPDGRSGYLAGYLENGSFRALIVDAPGLDPLAPWPMLMHDPGHTSNAATDLSPYRCPQ